MSLLPINGHILVELIDEKIKFDNGMELRETKSKKDLVKGRLIAGELITEIQIGSTVYYPLYAAIDFNYEGKKYHIIHKEDIVIVS